MAPQKWQLPILTFKRGVNTKSVSQSTASSQRSIARLHLSHLSKKTFSWNKMPRLAFWLNDPSEAFWNISTSQVWRQLSRQSVESRGNLAGQTTPHEKRLGVNWKHSATASSLRHVIGKEIRTSGKIYRDALEWRGAQLNVIEAPLSTHPTEAARQSQHWQKAQYLSFPFHFFTCEIKILQR